MVCLKLKKLAQESNRKISRSKPRFCSAAGKFTTSSLFSDFLPRKVPHKVLHHFWLGPPVAYDLSIRSIFHASTLSGVLEDEKGVAGSLRANMFVKRLVFRLVLRCFWFRLFDGFFWGKFWKQNTVYETWTRKWTILNRFSCCPMCSCGSPYLFHPWMRLAWIVSAVQPPPASSPPKPVWRCQKMLLGCPSERPGSSDLKDPSSCMLRMQKQKKQ